MKNQKKKKRLNRQNNSCGCIHIHLEEEFFKERKGSGNLSNTNLNFFF